MVGRPTVDRPRRDVTAFEGDRRESWRAPIEVGVAVIGSGASGSWLVRALAEAHYTGTVLVVDDGSTPLRDRVWSSWSGVTADSDDTGGALRRLVVAGDAGLLDLASTSYEYASVHGDRLWSLTSQALDTMSGSRLRTRAVSVRDAEDHAVVETDIGPIRAGWVFDSVGLQEARGVRPPRAWMEFEGWDVHLPNAPFDPDALMLMDFRVPQRGDVAFAHVLPLSEDCALVELTVFTTRRTAVDRSDDLHDYIDRMANRTDWTITRQESGRFPLTSTQPRRRHSRVVPIGARAGLVKPSTGYGYSRMRRDARRIAESMAAGRPPSRWQPPWRHRAMDAVFLELVGTDPAAVVLALDRMFRANPADRVVAFLEDETTVAEDLRLIATLPVVPFLRAALRVRPK